MEPTEKCPICGTAILTRVYRASTKRITRLPPRDDMALIAYRCQNGHISMVESERSEENARILAAA